MIGRDLHRQLTQLRTRIRVVLVLYGVCTFAAGLVAAAGTMLIADWLLWLPDRVRLTLAIGLVAGGFLALARLAVTPLRRTTSLDDLASRVEKRLCVPADSVRSAIGFIAGTMSGATGLADRVVRQVEDRLRDARLSSVVDYRPLGLRFMYMIAVLGVAALVYVTYPAGVRTGLARFMEPFGDTEWPRHVEIVTLTSDTIVAIGDRVDTRAYVARGDHARRRCVLHVRDRGGGTSVLAMQPAGGGDYVCTIPPVTGDLEYWFEAGDDSTRDEPVRVRVVPRPTVARAVAHVQPPDYARTMPSREYDLLDGPAIVTPGSRVTLELQAAGPPGLDERGRPQARVLLADGIEIDLTMGPDEPTVFTATLHPIADTTFQVRIVDEHGLVNRDRDYQIEIRPDTPPTVEIRRPNQTLEVTPSGAIRVELAANDDFGVSGLRLEPRSDNGNALPGPEVTPAMQRTARTDGVRATAVVDWPLAPLDLTEGDTVTVVAVATDNRRTGDAGPQEGRSRAARLRIISREQFAQRMRDAFDRIQSRLRRATADQIRLVERTRDAGQREPSQQRKDGFRIAAGMQDRLADRTRTLARELEELRYRMDRNRFDDASSRSRAADAARDLTCAAEGAMANAIARLGDAAAGEGRSEERAAAAAVDEQESAVGLMRNVLQQLGEWSDYQAIVTQTGRLLEDQQRVRRNTGAVGRRTLGQSVDDLPADDLRALESAGRGQQEAASDARQLLTRMQRLAESNAAADGQTAGEAQAVKVALRVAREGVLLDRMEQAGRAINANRVSAAATGQRAAEMCMDRMLTALRQANRDDMDDAIAALEHLVSQLADAVATQQQLLNDTTRQPADLADPQEAARLGDRQGRLADRVGTIVSESAAAEHHVTSEMTDRIRSAQPPMRTAESELHGRSRDRAAAAQTEALARLRRALGEAASAAARARYDAELRSLMAIRSKIQALRDAQQTIADGVDQLLTVVRSGKRLRRADTRRASDLACVQTDTIGETGELADTLKSSVAFQWLMTRVLAAMQTSREGLADRRIDDVLDATQQRILADLDRMLAALRQLERLPSPSPNEGQAAGGGGGGSGGRGGPTVPPAAELLVLKAMQVDLNRRTRDLDADLDAGRPSEEHLQRIEALGRDQQQLKTLTQTMMMRLQRR